MKKLIYFLEDFKYLGKTINNLYNPESEVVTFGKLERKRFSDGERYLRVLDNPSGEHCVIVGGTTTNNNTLEIFDLGTKLVQMGASKLSLVIPYFSHSTMEREVLKGEVVKAKTRANLLSAIPRSAYGNEVILFDLHADCITNYFSENVTTIHLTTIAQIKDIIWAKLGFHSETELTIASTDVGRAKTIEYICRTNPQFFTPAYIYKRRNPDKEETDVTGINADVKDKIVIIYDDMIRSGGSFIKGAEKYLESGAKEVYGITTHLVSTDECIDKINKSCIIKLLVSDSHPNAIKAAKRCKKIQLFSIFDKAK